MPENVFVIPYFPCTSASIVQATSSENCCLSNVFLYFKANSAATSVEAPASCVSVKRCTASCALELNAGNAVVAASTFSQAFKAFDKSATDVVRFAMAFPLLVKMTSADPDGETIDNWCR